MQRRSVAAITLLTLALLSMACGPTSEQMETESGAEPVSFEKNAKIGDLEVNLIVGRTVLERTRLQRVADLRGEKSAIAMVFNSRSEGVEDVLTLAPDFNAPADLVFVNKAGKIVKIGVSETGDGYVPFGMTTEQTGRGNGANFYSSGEPASLALFLSPGSVAKMKLVPGGELKMTPNLLSADSLKLADPAGVALYFVPRSANDRQREEKLSKPVKMTTRMAITAEDRARGILPNEDSLLLLYPKRDDKWMSDGFWLKGKEGKFSIAFMRLTQSQAGSNPMYGAVQDIIEDIQAGEGGDLNQGIWWPSDRRISDVQSQGASVPIDIAGPVNAVLVMRGAHAFSERKPAIIKSMTIVTPPLVIQNPENFAQHGVLVEENSLDGHTVTLGKSTYSLELVRTQEGVTKSISDATSRGAATLDLLVWDSAAQVRLSNRGKASVKVALLDDSKLGSGTRANLTVSKIVDVAAGTSDVNPNATSRFAIPLNGGVSLEAGASVELPWQVANLRPRLRMGAFYSVDGVLSREITPTVPEGGKRVWLEVADTDMLISRGLGFRTSLPKDQGMIFDFKSNETHSFWMKNCLMDIDVAFIDKNGMVANIYTMPKPAPGTPDSELELYDSEVPVIYAVEMEGGWFDANDIGVGDYFWVPEPLRSE